MKILGRFVFFSLALVFGTQLTLFIASMNTMPEMNSLVVVDERVGMFPERAIIPSGITVAYAGMHKSEEYGSYLKFIIHNGTNAPIRYGSKGAYLPIPEVLVDGKRQPDRYRCGSGSNAYLIEPNMSAEVRVRETEFERLPRRNATISVGYYLSDPHSGSGDDIFSEPFVIPEQFRDSIKVRRS